MWGILFFETDDRFPKQIDLNSMSLFELESSGGPICASMHNNEKWSEFNEVKDFASILQNFVWNKVVDAYRQKQKNILNIYQQQFSI